MADGRRLLNPASTLHCLPFTTNDTRTMLERAAPPDVVEAHWAQLEKWRALPTLTNPFVASMCMEVLTTAPKHLQEAHDGACDPAWQPLHSTDIYSAYLRLKLGAQDGSSMPRAAAVTSGAAMMTAAGVSHSTVAWLGGNIQEYSAVLRFESLDPASSVSFRHKSLQEFIVARGIACELLGDHKHTSPTSGMSLLSAMPSVSLHFPNMIALLAALIQHRTDTFHTASVALRKIALHKANPHAAATALGTLVRTGIPLGNFFENDHLEGAQFTAADLQTANFGCLSLHHTTFRDCNMRATKFRDADITNCCITDCNFSELPTFSGHSGA
jgi:hypothetical protein